MGGFHSVLQELHNGNGYVCALAAPGNSASAHVRTFFIWQPPSSHGDHLPHMAGGDHARADPDRADMDRVLYAQMLRGPRCSRDAATGRCRESATFLIWQVHGGLEEIHALEHLRIDAADGSLDGYLEKVEKARTFLI